MITSLQFSQPEKQLTLNYLDSFLVPDGNRHVARCGDLQLASEFHAIYSLAHQRMVGVEGLVRPSLKEQGAISPSALFGSANSLEEIIFLDRMCRLLHVCNFMQQADERTWLFLNVSPLVTLYGRRHGAFFSQLLDYCGLPPHRVVIEVLEGEIDDEGLLAESVDYYRSIGCLIAIDDFGVGHSNFNRICRLSPHIVKLDRTLIEQASENAAVQRILPGLVDLIHETGALALMEGVETEEQALIAMRSHADLVQGFYFSRPERNLPGFSYHPGIADLFGMLKQGVQVSEEKNSGALAVFRDAFFAGILRYREGRDVEEAMQDFLAMPAAACVYLLDQDGRQIGHNLLSAANYMQDDVRFAPLADARSANWSRRQYFLRAIAESGRIQTSKPYLSISNGHLCVTLSIALSTERGSQVICGDVVWTD